MGKPEVQGRRFALLVLPTHRKAQSSSEVRPFTGDADKACGYDGIDVGERLELLPKLDVVRALA